MAGFVNGKMLLVEAIAREEGFYAVGTRPQRNNNPGDLEFESWQRDYGATHGDPRFAIFRDAASGFRALTALLRNDYKGLTVEQTIHKYAPSNENDTETYIARICLWVGCKHTDVIDSLL